jgi:hypothetical protein
MGIIGNTHGVIIAQSPARNESQKNNHREDVLERSSSCGSMFFVTFRESLDESTDFEKRVSTFFTVSFKVITFSTSSFFF